MDKFIKCITQCMGLEGAKSVAEKLKEKKLDWVLDEGMMVLKDFYPYVSAPVAQSVALLFSDSIIVSKKIISEYIFIKLNQ